MNLSDFTIRAATAWRLGPMNVARVAAYRAQLRTGLGAASAKPYQIPSGDFFIAPTASRRWPDAPPFLPLLHFGWLPSPMTSDGRPDWFLNPASGVRFARTSDPWYRLPDFDPAVGDIKFIWELSRFDWVLRLAQHVCSAPDEKGLETLNDWLRDWSSKNPGYTGPNWKCGQEASIRVLHLAFAARLLGQVDEPTEALKALIRLHLRRIAPTISYAIGQDNNHGTSEAAALFVGGTWLASLNHDPEAKQWAEIGRRLIENRVRRLVMSDGSFSQYSVNYHRMVLDTLVMTEIWRRDHTAQPFSEHFHHRARAATLWLQAFVQSENGDVPNLGANDGSRLLPLSDGYTDFRPSLQLAAHVFCSARAFPAGPWDSPLDWLGIEPSNQILAPQSSRLFDNGGYARLTVAQIKVYIRYPRFRFRPGQADVFHLDLWRNGVNELRDAGTYSYNTDAATLSYFTGAAAHNTVSFDDHDQMPRVSRFLLGSWLDTKDLTYAAAEGAPQTFSAGYRDWMGATHNRTVRLTSSALEVDDVIGGFRKRAILRWRLGVGIWTLDGSTVFGNGMKLTVSSEKAVTATLVGGFASRRYGQKEPIQVLQVEATEAQTLRTRVSWST